MKAISQKKKSNWEWYAVKLLFKSIISGDPTRSKIDKNYTADSHQVYEESIILVKAQSFEHAYKVAEHKAIKQEVSYYNCYDQLVEWKYVRALDAFNLFDDTLRTGTKLYSRIMHVPKDVQEDEVVKAYYPETIEADDNEPDYHFVLRNREFNAPLLNTERESVDD